MYRSQYDTNCGVKMQVVGLTQWGVLLSCCAQKVRWLDVSRQVPAEDLSVVPVFWGLNEIVRELGCRIKTVWWRGWCGGVV